MIGAAGHFGCLFFRHHGIAGYRIASIGWDILVTTTPALSAPAAMPELRYRPISFRTAVLADG